MDRYRKRRFAKNLDALLTSRCVNRKEAAAEAQVPYQWLRRAVSEGISRPDKRSQGHLESLARYFGLPDVERFWDRDLYVPPPPSSQATEADRLAELMREYVLLVGAEDGLLREIVTRMTAVVEDHREREKKLAAEEQRRKWEIAADKERRSPKEEAFARIEKLHGSRGDLEALAAWQEKRERTRLEEEERRREQEERAKSFREADERVQSVARLLELFRLEVVEKWRSLGVPRVSEVELTLAEVIRVGERHSLKTVQELAPHVSDLWLAKYAQMLGIEPGEAKSYIQRHVSAAYGVGWAFPDEGAESSSASEGAVPERRTADIEVGAGGPPWWRASYASPPSSIKDEAARLGEEMQEYVRLVGEQDATLWKIIQQIRAAVQTYLRPEDRQARTAERTASTEEATPPPQAQQHPTGGVGMSLAARIAATRQTIKEEQEAARQEVPVSQDPRSQLQESAERHPSPSSGTPCLDLAQQALDELESRYFRAYRDTGLPKIGDVILTHEEVAEHADRLGISTLEELTEYAGRYLWLPKYALVLGKPADEARRFVWKHIEACSARMGDETQEDDRTTMPVEARPERDASEEEAHARTTAKSMVPRVLELLTPEQAAHFRQGYRSDRQAELYLEDDLFMRIVGWKTCEKQAPEKAVRAVVAEIAEDYSKTQADWIDDGTGFMLDEAIEMESQALEARRGDDLAPDGEDNHDGTPLLVGAALEAEITRSIADDKQETGRSVDEVLEILSDYPLPGAKGSYGNRIKQFGEPRSVVAMALRDANGDVGKALHWLVDKVNSSIKDERSRIPPQEQARPTRHRRGLPTNGGPSKKRQSAEASPEDLRRFIMTAHEDGLAIREIAVALRTEADDLPEWVRSKGTAELSEIVRRILTENKPQVDERSPNDFDPKVQDDKRAWEMGYERDADILDQ